MSNKISIGHKTGPKPTKILPPYPFKIQSAEDVKNIPGNWYKNSTYVLYHCRTCGIEYKKRLVNFLQNPNMLCRACNIKISNFAKYGVENVSQLKGVKTKKSQTLFEHFGEQVSCPAKIKEITERAKKTCLERYGAESFAQTDLFRQKQRESFERKTLEEKKLQRSRRGRKYLYEGEKFDSGWELAVWIYFKAKGIGIQRFKSSIPYNFEGKEHFYIPDFVINGKLVEIKGDQFFKNGKMICPFDRSKDDLYEAKYQCMLQNNVEVWREKDIKYVLDWIKEQEIDLAKYRLFKVIPKRNLQLMQRKRK